MTTLRSSSPLPPPLRAVLSLAPGGPAQTSARVRAGAVVVPVVVMLVVGFWGLDRGSMWQDEAATYTVATRPVHQILRVLQNIDLVHGAYYLFEHVWLQLGGGGEVWMRIPSVLASGIAAGATAALGVRLAGARTGLVAGLLFAGWPLVSYYAQEGRSYALVTAAVLVGTCCLVRALSGGSVRWWWGYGFSIVVAATLHEFAVLAVAAHAVIVLLVRPPWRVWRWWLVSALVCAVLVAPLAVLSVRQADQLSYMTAPTAATLRDLGEKVFGTSAWLPVVLVVLVVLGSVVEVRRWRRHEGGGLAAVALPLLLVPVVVLLGASEVKPLFGVRYVLFSVSGLPLLAARGVDQLATLAGRVVAPTTGVATGRLTGRAVVGPVVAALLVVGVSLGQLPDLRFERTVQSRHEDFAGAAAIVGAQARPGDAVIFIPSSYRLAALAYPRSFTGLVDVCLRRTAVQAANLRGTTLPPKDIGRAMLARDRIWLVGTSTLQAKSTDSVGTAELAVLRAHFRQRGTFAAHGVRVALFVRTGR